MTKPKKPDSIDLDKKSLESLRNLTKITEKYEGFVVGALNEHAEGLIDEDVLEERREEFRKIFLNDITEAIKKLDSNTTELKFKKILYDNFLEQIKRNFGYFQAVQEIQTKILQYNMELGDNVLTLQTEKHLSLIEKLEDIKTILSLADALNLPEKHIDLIVSNIINKEFGPKHTGK